MPTAPTTAVTLGRAYSCILDRWADGATTDHRSLLIGAFAGFTQELQRRGLDQSAAMPPAFSGDPARDWTATREVLGRVADALPEDLAAGHDPALDDAARTLQQH